MLLTEFLEPLGVPQVEAATRMNIPFQRLNAIVKGRRRVSADTALLREALITPHGSRGCGNPQQPAHDAVVIAAIAIAEIRRACADTAR
jgi:hypothetical protein